jgi:2-polyprenyl-3-methyl-5-hydroxy-6-metoxy-1,4-benzoquinol methylase
MKNYFSKHYAAINDIDIHDKNSLKQWYSQQSTHYDRELLPYVGDLRGKRVLEAGCGIGGLLYYLKQSGVENFFGIDISEEQISIARQYVTDRLKECDVSEFLASKKETYDCIIMYDLIEHIKKESIIPLIGYIYAALAENGVVIIRTPNMGSRTGLYSRYIDFTHETGFTEESIKQVFSQYPFREVAVYDAYIGRKRKFIVSLHRHLLKKIYNVRLSSVVTPNLIGIARK